MKNIAPAIAEWINGFGLGEDVSLFLGRLALLVIAIILAVFANWFTKRLLVRSIKAILRATHSTWDDILVERRVFDRLSHVAPAMVIYGFAPMIFPEQPSLLAFVHRLCVAYIIFVGAFVVDAILDVTGDTLRKSPALRDKPVRNYIQVLKLILFLVTAILILATLIDRSPWALLSGLGAMTAIVMLVFKDSILSFVASVQLSIYDLVRVGDWIEVPSYKADGDVTDISLNVIKVQNWDKTITSIPTHALMSASFKNWRGMSDSGGRRIKRSLNLDMTSVRFLDQQLVDRFKHVHVLKDYVEQKVSELEQYNREHSIDESVSINGRRLTNIGTFRAYVIAYLRSHPKIHQNMTLLVRQLAPTQQGLPIEIYAFSNDQNWNNYEGIISDIFDHLLAVLPEFELRVFQDPTGADFQRLCLNSTAQA